MKFKGLAVLTSVAILSFGGGLQSKAAELNNDETPSIVSVTNQVNVDYASVIKSYSDVEKYLGLLEAYKASNPESTLKEQDEYLSEIMGADLLLNNDFNIEIAPLADYDYIPIVSDRLTEPEKKVFNSNKVYGLAALAAAQKATMNAEGIYTKASLHNGNGDAFRHTLWNAYMTDTTSKSYAASFATAHEDGYPGQPAIERSMDLNNNALGRTVVIKLPNLSGEIEAVKTVQALIDGGKAKRISGTSLVATNSKEKK